MVDLSWLAGRAKTKYTHSTSPISLSTKSGSRTTLPEICQEVIPQCHLNPLLFNGHLQTFWTAVKEAGPPIHYKRRIFQSTSSTYAGEFTVDFVVDEESPDDNTLPPRTTYYPDDDFEDVGSLDERPMLVALHGLSGGSYEVYLRHCLVPLIEAGWEACVVNSRGCAMSKITSSVLYNARATWDIRQMVTWLRKMFPNRPLYGIGFSLGANIMTNYLGEEGSRSELKAAVVVSNPWNLEVSSLCLQRSWIGLEVYSKTMGGNMRKLFETHADQILKNPKMDAEKIRSAKYLHEFDRYVQGPTWGYPTEGAYYRDAASVDPMLAIEVPFLAINAEDDPIACNEAIPYEEIKQNPYAVLCTTSLGGHLSWYEIGGGRWFAKAAAGFLIKMAKDVSLEAPAGKRPTGDGHVVESETGAVFDPTNRRMIVPRA